MAITRGTLRLARNLRRDIGTEVDSTVRALTTAWVKEWDQLATGWHLAAADLVAEAGRLQHWPRPTDIARLPRVITVLDGSEQALGDLADRTGELATAAAGRVIDADVAYEPRIIASQAPAAEREALLRHVGGPVPVAEQDRDTVQLLVLSRIRTDAVDVIRNRAAGQITSDLLPLSGEASEAMRRELIRGVDVGANPREAAARMVASVEGRFNGGLTRALTISRTEILDAYRATSQQIHAANADVVPGWQWLAELDLRTCPSCWSMHGQQFPSAVPGPDDHPQGRCARIPVLASWAELGIKAPEPPSVMVDAKARFWSLPEADRLAIMGPARLRLLTDGSIDWSQLAVRKTNRGWRTSYIPTSVGNLQTLARHRGGGTTPVPIRPPAPVARPTRPVTPRAGNPPELTGHQPRWWDQLSDDTGPTPVPVRDMSISTDYLIRSGQAWRLDGVTYLVEDGTEVAASRVVDEFRQVHGELPGQYQRGYAWLAGRNPDDIYWAERYRRPDFTSTATAGDGSVRMWNRRNTPLGPYSFRDVLHHEFGHNVSSAVAELGLHDRGPVWAAAVTADRGPAGRVAQFRATRSLRAGTLSWDPQPTRPFPDGVTAYGTSSVVEDYAESVSMYLGGSLGTGVLAGTSRQVEIYFRDLFPARAAVLDRLFPAVAREQRAAVAGR